MNAPRVVIFNDTHGWHSEQLVASLRQLGIETILTDLAECQIDLDSPTGITIPGLEDKLPAAVMVRGIAPGFLEQITLRMDVLHTLAELGVPVFNPASAIEHTVDKARTSLRLHLAGIKTPKTWACENAETARKIVIKQLENDGSLVMKPLFGCQGKGIALIENLEDFEQQRPVGEAFYLQEYVQPEQTDIWQDWRLLVIDGEVSAAMSRRSSHWITNFAQGANCFATPVSDEMRQLAIKATQAVNADYAGVDLIRTQSGQFSVLEVNSVPAWKGLHQATSSDVAGALAKAILRRIDKAASSHHAV
ncbi:ATP-grasp domain-containing protein [Methylophaga sp.]|uniref:ATP-grasp domain-containing protein n=1 Tax=Methylophaga sp. TaxID=2024840 RepID=UPI003F697425